MFTRIVVAIDGSRTSSRAFNTALELAVTHHAVLQPFYVIEEAPIYYDVPGYDPSILRTQLADQGATLAAETNAAMKQRGVEGQVLVSEASSVEDVADLVFKAATAFNADLLVMGTHGRKGFQRLILGSVAERCLRQATLPVLLIPSAAGGEDVAAQVAAEALEQSCARGPVAPRHCNKLSATFCRRILHGINGTIFLVTDQGSKLFV